MILEFINSDEETIELDLIRYEKENTEHVSKYNNFTQQQYKLFVGNIPKRIESFLKSSYEVHVFIYFDDDKEDYRNGRVKKFYTPSIKIKERYIQVEQLISFEY